VVYTSWSCQRGRRSPTVRTGERTRGHARRGRHSQLGESWTGATRMQT
jgi:hypothetical protein